ncbi:MAG: DoxX family protein [Bradymonadaceae bacterium]|nr:DoxX family protein [Lujinxingiaceae bacterium]
MLLKNETRELLNSIGLLIMRVWIGGVMFLKHGWPKLSSFSERMDTFADPLGVGSTASLVMTISAEVGCALLVVVGLGTRLASAPLLFAMLVAAFIVHGNDPWQKQEFALLFGMTFLMLIFTGPGKFSLDHIVFKKYTERSTKR